MRKVLSTILLLVLAFNWLGYELVARLLISNQRAVAQRDIDNRRYDARRLVEIRVDLGLPYGTDWEAFEAVEGVVTYQGTVYNFVERKFEKGQMVYRCLPNQRGTELQNAREYFQSLVFDLDSRDGTEQAPKPMPSVKKPSLETTVTEPALSVAGLPGFPSHIPSRHFSPARDGFGFIPAEPPEA